MEDMFTNVLQPHSFHSKQDISDRLLIAGNRCIDRSMVKIFEIWVGSTDWSVAVWVLEVSL